MLIAATVITVCNVYILDLISTYILKPDNFLAVFGIDDERARSWSSTASGLVQTLLFSVAPYLFEVLANMEGSATSAGKAQRNALLYFWCFYVVARFMGKIVWDAVLSLWAGCKSCDRAVNTIRSCLLTHSVLLILPHTMSYQLANSGSRRVHHRGHYATITDSYIVPRSTRLDLHHLFLYFDMATYLFSSVV